MKQPRRKGIPCFDCPDGRLVRKRKHPIQHDLFGILLTVEDQAYVCDRCGESTLGWNRVFGHGIRLDRAYRAAIGAPDRKTIRKRRKQLGLSREDLARMLGVEEAKIWQWERGVLFSPEENLGLKEALKL